MRRTGVVALERAGAELPPYFRGIVGLADDAQRPRVLRVDTRVLLPGLDELDQRSLAYAAGTCGVWWSGVGDDAIPWQGGAALKITLGSTPGILRTLYCDLRSGEYAIPPCQVLDVSAAYWRPLGQLDDELGAAPLEVAVEIADGELCESSPLTCSAWRMQNAGYTASCSTPPGAYAFEILSGERTHVAAWCGDQRIVRVQGGVWTPPSTPVLIAGRRCHGVDVWTDDLISADGSQETATWLAGLVFWLR